jgi:hypothetical protein
MSIRAVTCYIVACDGEIHFDSPDYAIRYVVNHYGWQLTDTGDPVCHRCAAAALCARDGHQYSEWTPCACHGLVPDYALFGCGLLRACLRDGCEQLEERTLAQLPTTQEPTTPGC